uniref:NVEALA domain-containing protein n=1 Tax=Bacteroides uniformis TaxID=820 RepID=UPI004024B945
MKKIMKIAFVATFAAVAGYGVYTNQKVDTMTDLMLANVEALANDESGAECPNGCSDIGWGTSKILECDCNYDHFSCCNRWGC